MAPGTADSSGTLRPPGTAGSMGMQSMAAAMASEQLRGRTSMFTNTSNGQPSAPMVGVNANEWTRQITETGKVYFFNKSTGASQWHVPNDLYKSRCLDPDKILKYTKVDEIIMPSTAHAMKGVDCVMEAPTGTNSRELRDSMLSHFHSHTRPEPPTEPQVQPPLESTRLLSVTILSARGLRDADFMPGSDKSDPYCRCEIVGKPNSWFKTGVVRDCLDPVWNHTELMEDYEEGDVLMFSVYDEDDASQNKNASISYMNEGPSQLFLDGDEFLGRIVISDDEVLRSSHSEYPLEDAGKDIEAFITVATHVVAAFPGALGLNTTDALLELKRVVRKDVEILMYELPPEPGEVVSFDPLHKKQGYTGNFFGVFEEHADRLEPGCSITVNKQTLVVDQIGPADVKHQVKGAQVRYLYFTTPIKGCIRDKMQWKKVVQTPEPGFNEKRIILWYDGLTHEVVRIPHIG
mmetsp:Transcript_132340/g.382581  ORF Transcript_132340/g.382581 Transcript_132340/m.382581 type:complete len:462 (-) Transcript_132340:132-1517(-)